MITEIDRDRWALRGIRAEIAEIQAKLGELAEAERVLVRKLATGAAIEDDSPPVLASPNGSGVRLSAALTKHEAAERVLREFGHPARIPAIVDRMLQDGFGANLDRQHLLNGVYTAMSRKPEIFVKTSPGMWALKEWEDVPMKKTS